MNDRFRVTEGESPALGLPEPAGESLWLRPFRVLHES